MKQKSNVRVGGRFTVTCRDAAGNLKWRDVAKNMVVDEGLDHLLDVLLVAGTPVSPWAIGLVSATPTIIAGDTAAVHAGWTEFVDYDELFRGVYVPVRTLETVSNSASPVVFTIDTNASSIGGAFIAEDPAISGLTGVLLCAAAFSAGNKGLDDNDTLTIQYDFSAADA